MGRERTHPKNPGIVQCAKSLIILPSTSSSESGIRPRREWVTLVPLSTCHEVPKWVRGAALRAHLSHVVI